MRLTYVSYLRVMAMMMVVLYHCLCYYTSVWNYDDAVTIDAYYCLACFLNHIDMPMFVFISGFLYACKLNRGGYCDTSKFIKSKIKRLLAPFIFWAIVVCLLISEKTFGEFIIYGASHLWFLGMLFIMFLIFHLSKNLWMNFSRKMENLAFIVLLLLSIALLRVPSNPGFIVYQTISYMYVFYAGIVICKRETLLTDTQSCKNMLPGLLTLLILSCIDIPGGRYIMKPISLWAVVCIFMYVRVLPFKENAILKTLDSCSMGIYLIHHVMIQFVLEYAAARNYMNEHLWLPFVAFPLIFVLSLVMTIFIKKIPYLKFVVG